MTLQLIMGPPNSGRAGLVLDGLTERLDEEPVLVVPTFDDVKRFERELCERVQGPVLGTGIEIFDWLFAEVARICGAEHPPLLSDAQRLAVVRAAIRRGDPRILARSARRPGFVAALDNLLAEIGAAGLDAAALAEQADDDYLAEIARLRAAYEEVCAEMGRGDEHVLAARALEALRQRPERWGGRPVFLYGFDDLSPQQLELVATFAEIVDVTATITCQDDEAVTLDEKLVLLEAAGERGEAEQIGQEIVALLDDGVAADEIAVVLRDIDRYAVLYRSVFRAVGIPVAVEGHIPFALTASGRGESIAEAAISEDDRRLELRATARAAGARAEIAELPGIDATAEAAATLEALRVPLWEGPADGRVRVLGPRAVRAAFPRHLFVASLQEGEFPRPERGGDLLSDTQRERLGLPARVEQIAEERHLFHTCLSRPTERLYLSYRTADDDGRAASPSPFLEDVRDTLAAEPPVRRQGLDNLALAPRERFAERLAAAAARAAVKPGKLQLPAAREHYAARSLFSASQLEEFRLCSYRWFVGHELDPRPLLPDREALDAGGLVHAVLERLYGERPGGEARPRGGDLAAWQRRGGELVEELAGAHNLGGEVPASRAARRRSQLQIDLLLERDAVDGSRLTPRPDLLEASFGHEGDEHPALRIEDPFDSPDGSLRASFDLRGKIDRIDVDGAGTTGLLRDYKTSSRIPTGKNLEQEGKLQLQLYALAASELFGIDPIGSVYEPLAAKERRARGILRKPEAAELLDGERFVRTDFIEGEEFDERLREARELAAGLVARIRDGDIRRDPLGGECPPWCSFASICRQERGARLADEEEDEE